MPTSRASDPSHAPGQPLCPRSREYPQQPWWPLHVQARGPIVSAYRFPFHLLGPFRPSLFCGLLAPRPSRFRLVSLAFSSGVASGSRGHAGVRLSSLQPTHPRPGAMTSSARTCPYETRRRKATPSTCPISCATTAPTRSSDRADESRGSRRSGTGVARRFGNHRAFVGTVPRRGYRLLARHDDLHATKPRASSRKASSGRQNYHVHSLLVRSC